MQNNWISEPFIGFINIGFVFTPICIGVSHRTARLETRINCYANTISAEHSIIRTGQLSLAGYFKAQPVRISTDVSPKKELYGGKLINYIAVALKN